MQPIQSLLWNSVITSARCELQR